MKRVPKYPINDIILNRRSLRAMSGAPMSDDELMPLFEAARWAPSSSNNQLWRFVYAKRGSQHWEDYFNLLSDGNKRWCKNAAVLVIVLSRKRAEYKDRYQRSHSFEAGAAFENLAIEGTSRGFVVHPMGGFDKENALAMLNLPDIWRVECMVAIGKKGNIKELAPKDQEREKNPSDRLPLSDIVYEGAFPIWLQNKKSS